MLLTELHHSPLRPEAFIAGISRNEATVSTILSRDQSDEWILQDCWIAEGSKRNDWIVLRSDDECWDTNPGHHAQRTRSVVVVGRVMVPTFRRGDGLVPFAQALVSGYVVVAETFREQPRFTSQPSSVAEQKVALVEKITWLGNRVRRRSRIQTRTNCADTSKLLWGMQAKLASRMLLNYKSVLSMAHLLSPPVAAPAASEPRGEAFGRPV